jgi:hypothetical protein
MVLTPPKIPHSLNLALKLVHLSQLPVYRLAISPFLSNLTDIRDVHEPGHLTKHIDDASY